MVFSVANLFFPLFLFIPLFLSFSVSLVSQAWRQLSWKFHGKMPGKAKMEKRNKRIQEEFQRRAKSAEDAPARAMAKLAAEQERTQTAFVTLSGGHLNPQALAKQVAQGGVAALLPAEEKVDLRKGVESGSRQAKAAPMQVSCDEECARVRVCSRLDFAGQLQGV